MWGAGNNLIIGGLLYGKLALFLHFLTGAEPGPRLVFNLMLGTAGIAAGLCMKAVELRRVKMSGRGDR